MFRIGIVSLLLFVVASSGTIADEQDEVCDGDDCDPGQTVFVQTISTKQRGHHLSAAAAKEDGPRRRRNTYTWHRRRGVHMPYEQSGSTAAVDLDFCDETNAEACNGDQCAFEKTDWATNEHYLECKAGAEHTLQSCSGPQQVWCAAPQGPTPEPTPTPTCPDCAPTQQCYAMGDPHYFSSFGAGHFNFQGSGLFQIAANKEGTFKVQAFQCPFKAGSVAPTIFKAFAISVNGDIITIINNQVLINGEAGGYTVSGTPATGWKLETEGCESCKSTISISAKGQSTWSRLDMNLILADASSSYGTCSGDLTTSQPDCEDTLFTMEQMEQIAASSMCSVPDCENPTPCPPTPPTSDTCDEAGFVTYEEALQKCTDHLETNDEVVIEACVLDYCMTGDEDTIDDFDDLEPTPPPPPTPATTEPPPRPTPAPTTAAPTAAPSLNPTPAPTADPTADPTAGPTPAPTADTTIDPTAAPTADPTTDPTGPQATTPPTPGPTAYTTTGPTGPQATTGPTHAPTAPTPPPTPAPPTDCFDTSTKFDFHESGEPVYNNLGGLGPNTNDPPVIRWSKVGQSRDIPFDIVIEAVGDYLPKDAGQNGLNGQFGQVNVKSGTEVTLKISFVDPAKNDAPVTLDEFEWTFFDIDHYEYDDGKPKAQEKIKVCGDNFKGRAVLKDNVIENWAEGGCSYFQSEELGSGCDNPKEPLKLGPITCDGRTSNQLAKAVALSFENADSIEITLQTGRGGGGRNFFFSGYSALQHENPCLPIDPCPPGTPLPTPEPPTSNPCTLACGRDNIWKPDGTGTRCGDHKSSQAECESKFVRKSDSYNKLCEYDGKKCSYGEKFECSASDYADACGITDPECAGFCDLIDIKKEGKTCGAFDGRRKSCGQHFESSTWKPSEADAGGTWNQKCRFDVDTKTCYAEEGGASCGAYKCDEALTTPPTPAPSDKGECDCAELQATIDQLRAELAATKPPIHQCKWVGASAGSDAWCNDNCNHNPPHCPAASCDCS